MTPKRFPLDLPPGMVAAGTILESEGRWYDGQLIRFFDKDKMPVGGWRRLVDADGVAIEPVDGGLGTVRGILGWRRDGGGVSVAFGTVRPGGSQGLFVVRGGVLFDITPEGEVLGGTVNTTAGSTPSPAGLFNPVAPESPYFLTDFDTYVLSVSGIYVLPELENADVYVVAGGGAGADTGGGGGGGGEVVLLTGQTLEGAVAVVIGTGGVRDGVVDGGSTSFGETVAEGGKGAVGATGGESGNGNPGGAASGGGGGGGASCEFEGDDAASAWHDPPDNTDLHFSVGGDGVIGLELDADAAPIVFGSGGAGGSRAVGENGDPEVFAGGSGQDDTGGGGSDTECITNPNGINGFDGNEEYGHTVIETRKGHGGGGGGSGVAGNGEEGVVLIRVPIV